MSKVLSKLQELGHRITHPSKGAAAVERRQFPIGLALGIVAAFAVVFILGRLSSGNANTTVREQQNQISALNKKIAVMADMQFSIDKHIKRIEAATKDLNDGLQTQLDQTSVNANRMEAVLQANIDDLREKLNKLQDQTNTVAVN